MNGIGIHALMIFVLSSSVFGQTAIENPDRPAMKSAGRRFELIEIWRITDPGDPFYFKSPRNLRIGPGGAVFVQDQDQILEFDVEGRFVRNYFKKGQGPGELNSVRAFIPTAEALIVQDIGSQKVVWFDRKGACLKETPAYKGETGMC